MSATSRSLPSRRTLAIVAVGIPTALVLIDHSLWPATGRGPLSWELRHATYLPWLVVKTAILAWSAGRFLGPNFYGWIVFVWTQILLDVQTFHASLANDDLLCQTLVSAQIGFLAVWTILGVAALPWRLTALLLAAAAVILQSQIMDKGWRGEALPFLQAVSAALVAGACFALRWAGFRAAPCIATHEADIDAASSNPRAFQFGVKHMLIWTAALVPLLLVTRGVEFYITRQLGFTDVYPAALLSGSTALVTIATIWLALGQGSLPLRLVGFAVVVAAASFALQWQSEQWIAQYGVWWNRGENILVAVARDLGGAKLWGKWFGLLSGLLAAMLLFLRAAGYRLSKANCSAGLKATPPVPA